VQFVTACVNYHGLKWMLFSIQLHFFYLSFVMMKIIVNTNSYVFSLQPTLPENSAAPAPAFYFNIHKNGPKGAKLLRADRVVTCLRNSGFRASRTHFDPEAVKTNANLAQFCAIMLRGFVSQTSTETEEF
jgi:hypothetical protein